MGGRVQRATDRLVAHELGEPGQRPYHFVEASVFTISDAELAVAARDEVASEKVCRWSAGRRVAP
jgi:hypothetical protein